MPGNFFDTNVLLYLASDDPDKADRAEAIVRDGGVISVQVLNEIANVARRKLRMSWADTSMFLAMLRGLLRVSPMTVAMHDTGMSLAERHGLSVWDSMILAAALHTGCDRLWSEDMQDGFLAEGGVRIVNPFRAIL